MYILIEDLKVCMDKNIKTFILKFVLVHHRNNIDLHFYTFYNNCTVGNIFINCFKEIPLKLLIITSTRN